MLSMRKGWVGRFLSPPVHSGKAWWSTVWERWVGGWVGGWEEAGATGMGVLSIRKGWVGRFLSPPVQSGKAA